MKRFTETTKWRDPWFRKLSPLAKLLWGYLIDNCNSIGIIELDMEAAAFDIGKAGNQSVNDSHLQELASRVKVLDNGKLFITKFIKFQYGRLSAECPAHKPILKLAQETGLQQTDIGYDYPNARVFEPKQNGSELEPVAKPFQDPLDIPLELHSPEFTAVWQKWMTFRRGLGKKPKDWSVLFREQLEWLVKFGPADAVEMINASIRGGWQGIFPLKPDQQTRKPMENQI